jgi:hypothetical protein
MACSAFAWLKSAQYNNQGQLRDEQMATLLFLGLSMPCLAVTFARFGRYRGDGRAKLVGVIVLCAIVLALGRPRGLEPEHRNRWRQGSSVFSGGRRLNGNYVITSRAKAAVPPGWCRDCCRSSGPLRRDRFATRLSSTLRLGPEGSSSKSAAA